MWLSACEMMKRLHYGPGRVFGELNTHVSHPKSVLPV